MATRMHAARLERELARRGWNATDLAKASGISVATISAARHGRPVANATLSKIANALLRAPVIPGVDDLLGPADGHPSNGALPDPTPA
jgi:DNA-binding Xre family transcriptional regulator